MWAVSWASPIHNYLSTAWVNTLEGQALGFHFAGMKIGRTEERFAWRRRSEWLSQDLPWPPPGASLTLNFDAPSALGAITVEVHYEIYDSLPLPVEVVRRAQSHLRIQSCSIPWLSNNWRWWNRNPLWTDRRRIFANLSRAGCFSLTYAFGGNMNPAADAPQRIGPMIRLRHPSPL